MASLPFTGPTPRHLLTLGMFVFGMDTLAYHELTHSIEWRHGTTDRHQARPASQYLGPGPETLSFSGVCIPELGGDYGAFETIQAMGDTGDDYPLLDGYGRVFGSYRIVRLERQHLVVLAGGVPRHTGFRIELERVS
ncbi:phage tail protein [Pelagerythrobacter sp.]|uniref:phage tail protein n=1 Tax=Pelagerythrobacter sp. TaxID=2800702 RepID=UPI0035B4309E